jgi:TRAP-type mannitol/chloroaromatic compound transport system permease small subunit
MRAIANLIDGFNGTIGKTLAWFSLGIVLVQFLVVLGRYVYGVGSLMMQESIIYMHGFLFMIAAAYTLREDGHVRVDILYREAHPKIKAWINLIGTLIFLLPMCYVIWTASLPYVQISWRILEGSRETSGIQGVYLLKTSILIFAVLMALQGVSIILRSILAIRGDEEERNKLKVSDA